MSLLNTRPFSDFTPKPILKRSCMLHTPLSKMAMAIRRAALHISSVAMLIRRAALHISSVAMLIRRAALHTSSVAMLICRAALHISSVKMAICRAFAELQLVPKVIYLRGGGTDNIWGGGGHFAWGSGTWFINFFAWERGSPLPEDALFCILETNLRCFCYTY